MSTSTQTDMAQPRHIPPKQDNPIVQEERKHEGAAVKAALAANVGVAIAKLAAWAFTQSSAMLSESVHSIADCTNEIVLMAGGRVARKKRKNPQHPRPSRRSPKCSPISRHEWRTGVSSWLR